MSNFILDEFKRMQDELAKLPEPISYIVLDPTVALSDKPTPQRDGRGRLYLCVSPAILDSMESRKAEFHPLHGTPVPDLTGIPIYNREDIPEGWITDAR